MNSFAVHIHPHGFAANSLTKQLRRLTTKLNLMNLYDILQVKPDCTLRQIRVAYKKLALANHPDRFRTAEEKERAHETFSLINAAHQILSDPEARACYDAKQNMKARMPGSTRRQSSKPSTSSKSTPGAPPSGASPHHERPRKERHGKKKKQYRETKGCGKSESGSSAPKSSHPRSKDDHKDHDHRDQRQKTYGRCQDGRPCLRCISQHNFCYQHRSQDPNQAKDRYSSTRSGDDKTGNTGDNEYTSCNFNSDVPIFGLNKNGQPCKRCIKTGDFCYQHETQRYKAGNRPKKGKGPSTHPPGPSTGCGIGPFGINKNGDYCKRCIKQSSFCYQHKYQEQRQY